MTQIFTQKLRLCNEEAGSHGCQLLVSQYYWFKLAFPYSKHFGPAYGACSLGRRLAVLHRYCLRILHLPLGSTLHTVCLHFCISSFTHLLSTIPHREHNVNCIMIPLGSGTTLWISEWPVPVRTIWTIVLH
jgi:hypothetical protein